jgi:hypothetical protein
VDKHVHVVVAAEDRVHLVSADRWHKWLKPEYLHRFVVPMRASDESGVFPGRNQCLLTTRQHMGHQIAGVRPHTTVFNLGGIGEDVRVEKPLADERGDWPVLCAGGLDSVSRGAVEVPSTMPRAAFLGLHLR